MTVTLVPEVVLDATACAATSPSSSIPRRHDRARADRRRPTRPPTPGGCRATAARARLRERPLAQLPARPARPAWSTLDLARPERRLLDVARGDVRRRRRARPGAHRRRRPALLRRRCGEAGYTAVGEFHYVHHQPDGTPYERPNALAEAVCAAAEEVGMRIVLLLDGVRARRRGTAARPGPAAVLRSDGRGLPGAARGAAAVGRRPAARHGRRRPALRARRLRADWLSAHRRALAPTRDLVLHLHADEQPREIAETLAASTAAGPWS